MRKYFLFLMVLLLIGGVVALEFDNVKSYDEAKREVTITNAFGLGDTIAKVTLLSELDVRVFDIGTGIKQKVAEFEIDNAEKYNNALKKMEFFDVRDNNKVMTRSFEYRYRVETGYKDVPITKPDEACNHLEDCQAIVIGSRRDYIYDWIPLEDTKKEDLPQGKIVIGIFLDVKDSEKGEWIPTLFGERIPEFAEWTSGLSDGLTHWFTFNESTGTSAGDLGGEIQATAVNMTLINRGGGVPTFSTEGIIGGSVLLTGTESNGGSITAVADTGFPVGTGDYALSVWINQTSATTGFIFQEEIAFPPYLTTQSGTGSLRLSWAGTDSSWVAVANTQNGEGWYHLVLNHKAGRTILYFNNTAVINQTGTGSLGAMQMILGNEKDNVGGFIGHFDEFGVWNRSLSGDEITALYNNHLGLTFGVPPDNSADVTLIAPLSQNFTSTQTLEFSANASDDSIVQNITLYINGSINSTITGGVEQNLTFNKTISISDGVWSYWFNATDDANQTSGSIKQTITIDSIAPTISITAPPYQTAFAKLGDSLNLNYTYADANPSICYYTYGGINTTITCGTNTTLNIDTTNRSVEVWVNDTLGNRGNDTQPFVFSLLEVNASIFTDNVLEGSTNEFRANISYLSSNFTNIDASLFYNNTEYTSTKSLGTNSLEFSRNISAVLVTSKTNISYYWEVRLTNSTGIFPYNLTVGNQTVNNINIDTCAVFTTLFINYSLVDEGTQIPFNTTVTNTSNVQYELLIYPVDSNSPVVNISGNFSANNNPKICLENDLGTSSYRIDLATSYGADLYANEDYYIQNATITNSSLPQNIVLYDLLKTDNTDFLITFKDTSYLLISNALIHIQRKYLSEGVFKTVEIQKTDPNGEAVGHFDTDGVVYSILVTKFGEVLGTFTNLAVICQDAIIGDCDLNLKASATINPLDDLEDIGNITYSMVFDPDARTITTNFVSTDGLTKTVNISTFNYDRFGNDSVCSQQVNSASSTIICTIPTTYSNSTVISKLSVDGNEVVQKIYTIQPDVFAEFGYDMGALTIVLMLTLPFMAISSTIGFLIAIVIGLVLASMLMIFSTSTLLGVGSSIIWLILAVGILIYKIARRGVL